MPCGTRPHSGRYIFVVFQGVPLPSSVLFSFEFHYTPKHGSWLNIAEIELSALSKQCLGKRRIDNLEELNSELKQWHTDRNKKQKGVDWQFTSEDARGKLKHLYPLLNF
ncbi:MAG TPA: hypothetical protein DD391_01145 [Clostridiales bacterium]|nr:hypothetical protein [Clostridiales bacterium]